MRTCFAIHGLVGLLAVSGVAVAAQSKDSREEFQRKRDAWCIEAGQRHLEYGLELRKQGLPTQAAEQIALAVEVSEQKNPGAGIVLGMMQSLDDKFWKKNMPKPTSAKIDAYVKAAKKLVVEDDKADLQLASWALQRKLADEADAEYRTLLRRRDAQLAFDEKGRIVLDAGTIPEGAAQRIRSEAIEINGALYVRDTFLTLLPELKTIYEKSSPELRVRSTRSLAEAEEMHALVVQLLPVLERDLGARPARCLPLVLLGERPVYEKWLDAVHLSAHKVVEGIASRLDAVAVVCTQKLEGDALRGCALHEMTHLYHDFVCAAVMPSWYAEGLADTFGGPGAWRTSEGRLETERVLDKPLLDALRAEGGSLAVRDLLQTKGIDLWSKDTNAARRFYTESWAFLRFLRTGAGSETSERLGQWESMCRGAMLGADFSGKHGDVDPSRAANDLFLKMFGKDLPKLEDGFDAWLKKL